MGYSILEYNLSVKSKFFYVNAIAPSVVGKLFPITYYPQNLNRSAFSCGILAKLPLTR